MTAQTVSGAVEKRSAVEQRVIAHQDWFATISPTHMPAAQLVQLAVAQYRKSKDLKEAADANPGSFMVAVAECARLGLVPGDTFHLVGFRDKNAPGGYSVTGIVDYTGEIELAYRSGEVESIHFEVVRARDFFRWNPTSMRIPVHEIPTNDDGQEGLGGQDDRGVLTGVYAYARLRDGAISQCVVLDRTEVAKHRDVAKTDKFWGPPWPKEGPWTPAMWKKTAIHQLERVIPTSPEYMTAKLRAQATAAETMPAEIAQAYARQPEHSELASPPMEAIGNGAGNGEDEGGGKGPRPQSRTIRGAVSRSEQPRSRARNEAMADIRTAVASAGLDGPEHKDLRLALVGTLASPDTPPLRLRSEAQLDADQAATAAGTLRKIARQCEESGQDFGEALRGVAEQARTLLGGA